MLPSTGYFKAIICPFYENGSCDRPYCHFKHLRRDITFRSKVSQSVKDDSTSLGTTSACRSEATETNEKTDSSGAEGKAEIHQLVNEAVKKLLESREVEDARSMTDKIVAQVVEKLKPSVSTNSASGCVVGPEKAAIGGTPGKHTGVPSCVTKPSACVYNPTPIAELKKRHIPVPVYMPTRENRVAAKRKSSSDVITKPWLEMLRESSNFEMTYKPTAIVNPSQEPAAETSSKTYVPTLRSDNSSSNSYDDGNSNDYSGKAKEAYYPKSKKRREEYVPKKIKTPLKSVHQLEDASLDDFEPEFNIIDEILTSAPRSLIDEVQASMENENSRDLYDIEPKFSEDEEGEEEETEEIVTNKPPMTKEVQKDARNARAICKDIPGVVAIEESIAGIENDDESDRKKLRKNCDEEKSKNSRRSSSSSSSSSSSNSSRDDKTRRDSSLLREERNNEKKEGGKKEEGETRRKKEHRRSKGKGGGGSHDGNSGGSKDGHDKNESRDKKNRHNSSSKREKKRSSSPNKDKDKDRSKDSRNNDVKRMSCHRGRNEDAAAAAAATTSSSRKDKVPGSKCEDGKTRERSRRDNKHSSSSLTTSSSSSSKSKNSDKSKSRKDEKKGGSRSSSCKKSGKSGDKKSRSRHKESSSSEAASHVEPEDRRSDSPLKSHYSLNEESLMETSDSDHDVEEECLKIFQEYEPRDNEAKGAESAKERRKSQAEERGTTEEVGRKRVAHPSAGETLVHSHRGKNLARKAPLPQQKMYERWRTAKEAVEEEKIAESKLFETEKSSEIDQGMCVSGHETRVHSGNTMSQASACNAHGINGNGKIRIAHVPYAMALALKKKKVIESKAAMEARALAAVQARTAAQTAKGSRVAHIPQVVPQLVAPEPLQAATQKFPINVRQYYVNMMHVICVQIYTKGEDAAERALREELACHDRCKALSVYKNSCMLATHRLRKEAEQGTNGEESLPPSGASGIVSHNAVLAGKSKGSWSVEKTKKSVMDYRGAALYERLRKWIATEQQLKDNGFPRSHPDGPKGRAKIYIANTRNQSILSKVPNERYCSRCGKPFMVNKHGFPVIQENCIYHWGRKFTTRGESKYTCCQQYGFASGCADGKYHVWDHVDYENLRGYVKTLPKDSSVESQGVYALDCEMSYTTQGLELTRVTVINDNCNTVYETLVMPENPILDYNTRFSGITEENMKGVKTTLLDVQATLLTMFSENTILIGHSLESDFKALKLIHDTVVDTSIMFPHKNGPPHKRALKNLCSEYLRKIIQNEVGGHDSAEDAIACMDLIHWKVKEEAKLE